MVSLFSFLRENTKKKQLSSFVLSERRFFSSGLLVFLGRKTYRLPYMSAKRHKVSEEDAIGDLHVLGSVVFDLLFSPKSLPTPGMTVLSKNVKKAAGGKGANQAYAAGKALSSSSPSVLSSSSSTMTTASSLRPCASMCVGVDVCTY